MDNETNSNSMEQAKQPERLNKKMKLCKTCGAQIAKNAKRCPACGAKNKKPIFKRVWFLLLCLIVLIVIGNLISNIISPPARATVTDNNGVTTQMLSSEIRDAYSENAQEATDRLGLAKAEITAKVLSVGQGKYETVNNKDFLYVDVRLEDGWELNLLKEPNESLLKVLKRGDTIHIESKISYSSVYGVRLRDFLIDGNTIYDRTVVTIVNP